MASIELIEKWKRIEDLLKLAISCVPNKSHQDIEGAEEFLAVNELELAYSCLRDYAEETGLDKSQFKNCLAAAAKEMGIE